MFIIFELRTYGIHMFQNIQKFIIVSRESGIYVLFP